MSSTVTPNELVNLQKPFPARVVSWRPGTVSRDEKRAQALPYVDPRLYEKRLDEVFGGDWGVTFKPWGSDRIIAEVTIRGQTRASTGEFDSQDRIAKGTTAEAQAFKRACSKWGLGRYLYDIPIVWVDYDKDRRRLKETPELTGRFDGPNDLRDGSPSDRVDASARAATETLSEDRAEAMQRELEKIGLDKSEQKKFASAVLGRAVRAFNELTETEALEVWNVARSTAQNFKDADRPTDEGEQVGTTQAVVEHIEGDDTPTAVPFSEEDTETVKIAKGTGKKIGQKRAVEMKNACEKLVGKEGFVLRYAQAVTKLDMKPFRLDLLTEAQAGEVYRSLRSTFDLKPEHFKGTLDEKRGALMRWAAGRLSIDGDKILTPSQTEELMRAVKNNPDAFIWRVQAIARNDVDALMTAEPEETGETPGLLPADTFIDTQGWKKQELIILRHLKEHGSISTQEAQEIYGLYRLPARVSDLRHKRGAIIQTHKDEKSGGRFARYTLEGWKPDAEGVIPGA